MTENHKCLTACEIVRADWSEMISQLDKDDFATGGIASTWVYLGVRTCEVFLCFVAIIFLHSIVLTSLFSLFYVNCERNRFLHRG